jgi:hypothetical protein
MARPTDDQLTTFAHAYARTGNGVAAACAAQLTGNVNLRVLATRTLHNPYVHQLVVKDLRRQLVEEYLG